VLVLIVLGVQVRVLSADFNVRVPWRDIAVLVAFGGIVVRVGLVVCCDYAFLLVWVIPSSLLFSCCASLEVLVLDKQLPGL
jgi:hypothetical protein